MKYMNRRPIKGIATDAAHSTKRGVTEFQGVDLETGERLFYRNLGNQTVNIGEFLGVVEAVKYILKNNLDIDTVYTDSVTAIAWYRKKSTASNKRFVGLKKAEIFLKLYSAQLEHIKVVHWDNKMWGETPADFGNK